MFTRNLSKFLVVILAFSLCTVSCKYFANFSSNKVQTADPTREIESVIPFSTKEPEVYQAEIVVTFYNEGEKLGRKTFVVRNGEKYLSTFDPGTEQEISYLKTGQQDFALYPAKKVYSESSVATLPPAERETLNDFLTVNWLNDKTPATFENLGQEDGLTKYAAKLDNSEGASEALIFVDEKLGMPVKQEFYSIEDGSKTLQYSSEIKDLKLQADDKYFELPADFKKLSPKEFHEIIWQGKQ